jgi:NAD(P)-dependent dehydrogenase (short-subunit alcohol dehydrogenase family)
MAKAALKHLKEGGSIINTGSITGLEGSRTLIDYASTKGAIHAFTKSLALSLAKRKIRVNCVAPGPIWTPLQPDSKPAEKVAKLRVFRVIRRLQLYQRRNPDNPGRRHPGRLTIARFLGSQAGSCANAGDLFSSHSFIAACDSNSPTSILSIVGPLSPTSRLSSGVISLTHST